jgi:hypothetical protein
VFLWHILLVIVLNSVTKTEVATKRKKGKREYLNDTENKKLLDELNKFFENKVESKRIRNGERQTLETLINEALIFAKFLRDENKDWTPRIP